MASEDRDPLHPLTLLEQERARLDGMLESNAAWRALQQLAEREAEGQPVSAVDAERLKSLLEATLSGDRVFLARRRIAEAITLLGAPQPPPSASSSPSPSPVSPTGPATGSPAAASAESAAVPPVRIAERIVTIAAVAARAAPPPSPVPATGPAAAPPLPAASDRPPKPDLPPGSDLTVIRGIDRRLAQRLAALGVRSIDDIAGWTAADVGRIASALDLGRTIQRQNWIEQAALLVARRPGGRRSADRAGDAAAVAPPAGIPPTVAAHPPRRVAELVAAAVRRILAKATPPALPPAAASPIALEPAPEPAPESAPEPAPKSTRTVAAAPPDDLTALGGVDFRLAALLVEQGAATFAAIARWTPDDVARIRHALGPGAPVVRAQWIEQAAMLAAGHPTHHARHRAARAAVPLAPRPAATAAARDEGLAAWLAQTFAQAIPQSSAPATSSAPSPRSTPTSPAAAPAADSTAALPEPISASPPPAPALPLPPAPPPVALHVRVLPPQPLAADPAPRPGVVIKLLPPVSLAEPASQPASISSPSPPVAPPSAATAAPVVELPDDLLALDFTDDGFDILDLVASEADVEIVARQSSPATSSSAAPDTPRPLTAPAGPGSLQSRLRRATGDDEFDGRDYAAYRGTVEEASVEIVRRPSSPVAGERAKDAAGERAKDEAKDGSGAGNGSPAPSAAPKTVRRFLKALTGQEP